MNYACEHCGFLFCRTGAAKECPSCEKNHIRFATKKETQRLQTLLEQGKPTLLKEEHRHEQKAFEYASFAEYDI